MHTHTQTQTRTHNTHIHEIIFFFLTRNHFLLNSGFSRGNVDKTSFLKRANSDLLILQVYVDDIVSGCSSENLDEKFFNLLNSEFEMSH